MSPKDSGATAVSSDASTNQRPTKQATPSGLTPTWWVPTSLVLMVLGLVWVITYYVSSGSYPIPGIDMFNIVIGFGFIMVGFVMLTRWK